MPKDDSRAARRCIDAAGCLPTSWKRFLACIASGEDPEDVVNDSGTIYGTHGRKLLDAIRENYDTQE